MEDLWRGLVEPLKALHIGVYRSLRGEVEQSQAGCGLVQGAGHGEHMQAVRPFVCVEISYYM